MTKAHVDMPVPREQLSDPAARKRIRMDIYLRAVRQFGRVRNIRYERDPFDGPLAEQGYPSEAVAIVRGVVDVDR